MRASFEKFINKYGLLPHTKQVLLAVSGGVDSMVMLHLFKELGIKIAVAHMNFGLRDKESDADEIFVKNWCEQKHVPFFSKKVDTKAYAVSHKLNTQLAARQLRYQWFDELMSTHKIDVLATAHHATDNVETFVIQALRGSGIEGLKGIPVKTDKLIRPLMGCSRNEIEVYALDNNIAYREDSSNLSDKYVRNKIRHHVLPIFEEINPSYHKSILHTTEILGGIWSLVASEMEKMEKEVLHEGVMETLSLNISDVKSYPHHTVLLYYILNRFGVNRFVYTDILASFDKESGLVFETATHLITKDRDALVIEKLDAVAQGFEFELSGYGQTETEIGLFKVERIARDHIRMTDSKTTALLDADLVTFPLLVRNRKEGDMFTPLGMQGTKLISDFFIDEKISQTQKNKVPLILSNSEIIWVAGRRISHHYKISASTKYVLRIIWTPVE